MNRKLDSFVLLSFTCFVMIDTTLFEQKITDLRNRILNFGIVLYAVFLSINFTFISLRTLPDGFTFAVLFQGGLTLGIILLAFFRKQLSLRLKIYAVMFLGFLALLSGFNTYGFLASSKIYILIIPVFVALIFSYRNALFILFLYILVYAAFGYLYSTGILVQTKVDANEFITRPLAWIAEANIILLTAWALVYVSHSLEKTILSNFKTIDKQHERIKEREESYRAYYNYNPLPTLSIRKSGNDLMVVDANEALLKYSKVPAERILYHKLAELFEAPNASKIEVLIHRVFETKKQQNIEIVEPFRTLKKLKYLNVFIGFVPPDLILLSFTDITDKKNAQKKIVNAMISGEERERARIAKELHDGISPVLSATKLYLQSLLATNDKNKQEEISGKIYSTMDEAIGGITDISNNLSPHVLQNFGFISALESFMEKIEETTRIEFLFSHNTSREIEEHMRANLYRVLIELINNTLKYGEASKVRIDIQEHDNLLDIYFEHNGKGFNLEETLKKKRKGMGLFNLINRIHSLNGEIDYQTSPEEGVKVKITAPFEKE